LFLCSESDLCLQVQLFPSERDMFQIVLDDFVPQ